ncbi:MAG: protein kinase [Planctomycetes bacterium]|nr:protein kinase [Planctomycetota bacterium]
MAEDTPTVGAPPQVQDRFGRIAVQLGFVTAEQLEEAVSVQRAAAKAGFRKRLGDILVKKGYLTPDQVQRILNGQTADAKSNRVGDYDILSKLGEGGMGAVYKAKQRGIERIVALKILSSKLAKDSEFRDRFIREARAVARLNHPNIVAGIDVGSDKGVYYFAMEFVDGESLGHRLQRKGGKLPEKEALEYARQVALALHHAHTHGLLHRDVKPENILIDKEGQTKLADLGLARSARTDDDANLTSAGMAVGTPYYISPEQARGMSDLTAGTDLYSLGATLFHLVTGKHVFEGPTGAVIMAKHVAEESPDPRDECPELSKRTALIIRRLLEKEPKDRFKDGEALAEDLAGALEACDSSRQRQPVKGSTTKEREPVMVEDAAEGAATTNIRAPRVSRRRRETDVSGGLLAVLGIVAGLALVMMFVFPPSGGSHSYPSASKPKTAPGTPETPKATAGSGAAKTAVKSASSKTDAEKTEPADKTADVVGIEPVAPPNETRPVETEPAPSAISSKKETPEKAAITSVKDLLPELAADLKAARFQDAVKAVEAFRKGGKDAEAAGLADTAVALVRQVNQTWVTERQKLDGKSLNVGGVKGVVGKITDADFSFTVDKGINMSRKWTEVAPEVRLELAGFPPGKPENQAERGFYLYFMGLEKDGAECILNADKAGQIKLTPDWRTIIEAAAPKEGSAKTEQPPVQPAAADEHPKAPAVPPKAVEKPVLKANASAFLKCKIASLSNVAGHVELLYDFTDAEQMKDFTQEGNGKWEIKENALLLAPQGGRGRSTVVHKAKWQGGQNFRIVAKVNFEETNDAIGFELRDRAEAGQSRYVALNIGGQGGGGGGGFGNGGNSGIGIRISENAGNNAVRSGWKYETGKDFLFTLAREGDKWSAKHGGWEIDNRKRKDVPEEWPGYAAIYSRNTKIKILELRIQGVLDAEWVKAAQAEAEK